ncbi:MAG: hypothetical protein HQK60_18525, partial [Deltaproteobacteria bacterium]|nr:hypothetical protein [Deltaproteobacteria bacterium]
MNTVVEIIVKGKTPLKPPKDELVKEPEPTKAPKKPKELYAPSVQGAKPPQVGQPSKEPVKTGPPEPKTKFQPVPKQIEVELPWEDCLGKAMVFQARGGVLYTGTIKRIKKNWMLLENPTISGKSYEVKPDFCWVDRSQIVHVHPV